MGSQQNQATKAGWMDAQGDGAKTGLATMVEDYGDGASSPELNGGDRKSRAKKGRTTTTSELYRAAKRAKRRQAVAFSTPA